jgi:hypothetical protein
MLNQLLNILASIIVLAMVSVALSRKSNTQGVLGAFFGGFGNTIKQAGNAGR